GKGEGGAAPVAAMDDDDLGVGEGDTAVGFADGGIVPLAYLAEKDAGQDLGRESEILAGLRQMVDRDDGADDRGELKQLCRHLGHVDIGQRNVGGREGDLVVAELLDARL